MGGGVHSDAGSIRLCCVLLGHLLSHTADGQWVRDASAAAPASVAASEAEMVCCADFSPAALTGLPAHVCRRAVSAAGLLKAACSRGHSAELQPHMHCSVQPDPPMKAGMPPCPKLKEPKLSSSAAWMSPVSLASVGIITGRAWRGAARLQSDATLLGEREQPEHCAFIGPFTSSDQAAHIWPCLSPACALLVNIGACCCCMRTRVKAIATASVIGTWLCRSHQHTHQPALFRVSALRRRLLPATCFQHNAISAWLCVKPKGYFCTASSHL